MLEVNRSDPLREAGPRLPGGKRQSGEISRISRMLGERNALAKRTQAGSVPAWAEPRGTKRKAFLHRRKSRAELSSRSVSLSGPLGPFELCLG